MGHFFVATAEWRDGLVGLASGHAETEEGDQTANGEMVWDFHFERSARFVPLLDVVEEPTRLSGLHYARTSHGLKLFSIFAKSSWTRFAAGNRIRILIPAIEIDTRFFRLKGPRTGWWAQNYSV
jgi:hypothetical protein